MGDLDFKNGLINAIYILSSRIEQVPIRQFVAAVFAETIYNNTWEVVAAQPLTERIAHLIKNKCNKDARQYNKLKGYNREGLYLLIETEWGLQNCENYISTDNNHWAYEYDASHSKILLNKFIDKRNEFEKNSGRPYPIQIAVCGDLGYNPTDTSDKVLAASSKKPIDQKTTTVSRGNPTGIDETAKRIKEELLSLYTKLVKNRGGEDVIKDFEYIWQWKVSEAEYNEIKKLLTSEECKNNIKNIITENKYCLLIVVIYIAENYKREYNGNDKNAENELEQIGLRGKSKGIVTNYFGEASPKVLQSETHTWWIDTLRLEGGLPINYIQANDSNANNKLARFAVKLYEDSSDAIKILEEEHNNQAIRHSYNEGYSLRKYIETLLQEGLYGVCCEGDINNEERIFSKFKDILENGRKEAQRNSKKFAYKYRVWTFQNEFLIHLSIVFKQDSSFSESQELISRERLEQWGVKGLGANEIFWLRVGEKKYEFHPWGKDFYRSDVGLTEFPLSTARAPQYSMLDPKIYYIGKDENELEVKSIVPEKAKYIKFTSDNGFDWMTGRSGEFSSVLLLKSGAKLEVENSEEVREVGDFRWVEFSNRVKIDGKYIYSSKLNVDPKDNVMHPVTKSKFIRNISFFKDEEKSAISLLDSSMIKAENFNIIGDNDEIEKTEVNSIKYKDNSTDSWKEYKGSDTPCGLVNLNIDGLRLPAYILPHDAKITCRNHSEGRGEIAISNIDEIEAEGYELNPISDGWLLKDIYKEENKDRDSILFKIKVADDEYLTFEVIRPLKREDKMIGKHIVSANARIPRRLESKYQIRRFDENGVSYCDDRSSQYDYSSKQIGFAQNRYFIDKGISPEVDEKLEFVFISESLEEYKLTLSRETVRESGRDISYIYLNNIPQGQIGVIIQTLEHVMPDLTYYEPKWIGMGKRNFKTSTALKRLQITIKHKLYPNVLMCCNQINDKRDEITPKLMIEYLASHCSDCEEKQRDYDWNMLWEMADELGKDWLYITRRQWENFATDIMPKELVCGLFMKRPKSSSTTFANFVEDYWSWKWVPRQGNTNDAYNFLNSVLGDVEKYSNSWKYTGSFPAEESLKIQMDRLIGNKK